MPKSASEQNIWRKIIFTNILVRGKLGEYCVRLLIALFLNSHQKTPLVSEHRLDVSVHQANEVFWVDECVATAVQLHLTVHLSTAAKVHTVQTKCIDTVRILSRRRMFGGIANIGSGVDIEGA